MGIGWVVYIYRRLYREKQNTSSTLCTLGITIGVMALIVVMGVMNGFQASSIETLLEVSSYHLRATVERAKCPLIEEELSHNPLVKAYVSFREAQSLIVSNKGRECVALIRALPYDVMLKDSGFKRRLTMQSARFNIHGKDFIVLGSGVAKSLGVRVGSSVNLLALSGSTDKELISKDRVFTVMGIFHTTYADINHSYVFINMDSAKDYLGESTSVTYGIKLYEPSRDIQALKTIKDIPGVKLTTWRDYNRAFFGALKIEKNTMLILVFLIFIVVGVNIYNSMNRTVYERRQDIAVLLSYGARKLHIMGIFILQGIANGFTGGILGVSLGLMINANMESVFLLTARTVYAFQYFFTMLVSPYNAANVAENSAFVLYSSIPTRMGFAEVASISFFGILSSLLSALLASKKILKLSPVEILHST